MKLKLNLELSYGEAIALAKYLPSDYDIDSTDVIVYQIRANICKALDLKEYDL